MAIFSHIHSPLSPSPLLFLLSFPLLLFLSSIPTTLTETLTVSYSDALTYATTLYNKGDHPSALSILTGVATASLSTPYEHEAYFLIGSIHQAANKHQDAKNAYENCLTLNPNHTDALNNLGKLHSDLNDLPSALNYYKLAVSTNETHLQSSINLGLLLHKSNDHASAASHYRLALLHHPTSDELHYNLAVNLQSSGEISSAVEHYRSAIEHRFDNFNSEHVEAWLNLAALHHKHGTIVDALWHYNKTVVAAITETGYSLLMNSMNKEEDTGDSEMFYTTVANDEFRAEILGMLLNNIGQALTGLGRVNDAISYFQSASKLLQQRIKITTNVELRITLADELIATRVHVFRASKMNCAWSHWSGFSKLLKDVTVYQIENNINPSISPFDSLGLPVSPAFRKKVAVLNAAHLSAFSDALPPLPPALVQKEKKSLRLGYICYDFNDHPTSHLAEGLFLHHNLTITSKVKVSAFNYGKNDNSTYRNNIVALLGGVEEKGGRFVELIDLGNDAALTKARESQLHVLVDLQGFTLGGRPEITARKVAPIQVNYLIFPGTSGASFLHYIVGDKYVTPPEHETHYTEKLALMPNSYQINYYERHLAELGDSDFFVYQRGSDSWRELRRSQGLSDEVETFVFANFNKQDKLEPAIWSTWIQVLARTPHSVLWLLEPSHRFKESGVVENLQNEAKALGINKNRIIFASRLNKVAHLKRVSAADLFLDSFLYGAHSTATDALRGGLPVLSLGGDSFAKRVGISLLMNLGGGLEEVLLVSTAREFVDVAVGLALEEGGLALEVISRKLVDRFSGSLFDTELYTADFERLVESMHEVRENCVLVRSEEERVCEECMHLSLV